MQIFTARTSEASRSAVRRLAVSRLISMAGTDASALAIGFSLYAKTHSSVWLSLSLFLSVGLGAVLAPIGGWLGDRFDRRRLMLGAELGSAALFLLAAVVPVPAVLLAMSVPGALLGAIFGASSGAAIAAIASEEDLAWANAAIGVGSNVGKTAGRLLGGVLVAVLGASVVFLVDAATFLASAALIATVLLPFGHGHGESRVAPPEETGAAAGMSYLLRHPVLAPVLAAACVSTLVTSFSMTAEVPLVDALGSGAVALGVLTACWGLGTVAGSWWSSRALHRGNEATGVLVGRAVMAAGIGLVALTPAIGLVFACYLIGGIGGGFMATASQSLLQRNTPDPLRARVLGATEAARNVAFGAGALIAGFAVSAIGPQLTFGLVGVGVLLGLIPLVRLVKDLGGPRSLRPASSSASA
jgi:MFS family permease